MDTIVKNKDSDISQEVKDEHFLVVWNDDFNTFNHVIKCLITICNHQEDQAQQCTYLIHHKGKCEVKKGDLDLLKGMARELELQGLTVTID